MITGNGCTGRRGGRIAIAPIVPRGEIVDIRGAVTGGYITGGRGMGWTIGEWKAGGAGTCTTVPPGWPTGCCPQARGAIHSTNAHQTTVENSLRAEPRNQGVIISPSPHLRRIAHLITHSLI